MRSHVPSDSSLYLFIHLPAPQCKQHKRGGAEQVNMVNYLPAFSPDWLDKIKTEHARTSLRVEEYTCARIRCPQVNCAAVQFGPVFTSTSPQNSLTRFEIPLLFLIVLLLFTLWDPHRAPASIPGKQKYPRQSWLMQSRCAQWHNRVSGRVCLP